MSWYTRFSTGKLSLYRRISKVDLHRHLEGSLRLKSLTEIAAQQRIYLSAKEFRAHVQMQPGDPLTSATFLSKFQTLRQFYRSQEIIERLAREVVEDAARDGVVHLELSFTPVALSRVQGFTPAQVMDWVSHSVQEAAIKTIFPVRLIASVNRHEPVELAEEVARLAAKEFEWDRRAGPGRERGAVLRAAFFGCVPQGARQRAAYHHPCRRVGRP